MEVNIVTCVMLAAGYGQTGQQQPGYGKPPGQAGYDGAGGYGMQGDYGADGSGYGQRGGGRGGGGMTHHSLLKTVNTSLSPACET